MPGNLLVRFDEGRVGRTVRCHPLSYSTERKGFSVTLLHRILASPQRSELHPKFLSPSTQRTQRNRQENRELIGLFSTHSFCQLPPVTPALWTQTYNERKPLC
jgi:hypothetical protein